MPDDKKKHTPMLHRLLSRKEEIPNVNARERERRVMVMLSGGGHTWARGG